MAIATRSFCELDLAPMLEANASESWGRAMRDHASRCFCCALRMDAIGRLAARLRPPSEAMPTPARNRRTRASMISRLVLGPVRRGAAVAAFGLATAFLALAVGHGAGTTAWALAAQPSTPAQSATLTFHRAGTGQPDRRTPEEHARDIARNGSPTPLNLMPPPPGN
jgi:hypothetical protein